MKQYKQQQKVKREFDHSGMQIWLNVIPGLHEPVTPTTQQKQQQKAYCDFYHVGDEGTSHHTGEETQYEVVHFPSAGPVYCVPHNEDTGRAKGGQYWHCPSGHCVSGMQWVAIPPHFLQ